VGTVRNRNSDVPSRVLEEINAALLGQLSAGFVTCCCVRFNADGTVLASNAGHPSPYRDGAEVELEPGLPLGVSPEAVYADSVLSGGRFTFVSDGVIEAANAKGELFGFDRTRKLSSGTAAEIAEAARAWGQNDDITVVTVRKAAS
jgi:serine phosphatase RsbU (regulator of sigma subunit)